MKKEFVLALTLAFVALSAAENLVLEDGRSYDDISVRKVRDGKMVIWHSSGIVSIPIEHLPETFEWTAVRKEMVAPYLKEKAEAERLEEIRLAEEQKQQALLAVKEELAVQEEKIAAQEEKIAILKEQEQITLKEKFDTATKHELPQAIHQKIFKMAERKHFIDEQMQLSEYEEQKAAYLWVEKYGTDEKILEYVKKKHPDDYIKMKKEYEYQTKEGNVIEEMNKKMKKFIFG